MPGIKDKISKTSEGLNTFKDWSDQDLFKKKCGWEDLGIAKGTLLLGLYKDVWQVVKSIPNRRISKHDA